MSKDSHHPPHIFIDKTWYMISAGIYNKLPILKSTKNKLLLRNLIAEYTKSYNLKLVAWVILDNHYHLLLKNDEGSSLVEFIRKLHGRSAYEINKIEENKGRQVWHNYWDTCIRDERDYWTRFNYIHHNPVKHGYIKNMEDWVYSSYTYYLEKRGEEWVRNLLLDYPVIDFTDKNDLFDTG